MKDDSWMKLRSYYNKAKNLAEEEARWVAVSVFILLGF